MLAEGIDEESIIQQWSLDLRYQGQSFTLNIPWPETDKNELFSSIDIKKNIIKNFHATHEQRYGHKLNEQVELVNIRISLKMPTKTLKWQQKLEKKQPGPISYVPLHTITKEVPLWRREDIPYDQKLPGPVIITESVATTFVKEGWEVKMDGNGHLTLNSTI